MNGTTSKLHTRDEECRMSYRNGREWPHPPRICWNNPTTTGGASEGTMFELSGSAIENRLAAVQSERPMTHQHERARNNTLKCSCFYVRLGRRSCKMQRPICAAVQSIFIYCFSKLDVGQRNKYRGIIQKLDQDPGWAWHCLKIHWKLERFYGRRLVVTFWQATGGNW